MSGDHHHAAHRQAEHHAAEHRTRLVVAITLAMMVLEVGAGYLYNSMALLADGWHMGTHAAALGITLFAYAYARNHPQINGDEARVRRVHSLGGFASAIVLMLVALYISWESLHRFVAPETIRYREAMVVAALGLAVNAGCARILSHDHSHSHAPTRPANARAREGGAWATLIDSYRTDLDALFARFGRLFVDSSGIDDLNLRAAYLHVLADALISICALVALALGALFGLGFLDPLVGLAGGIVIARWSLGLVRETSRDLLGLTPGET